MHDTYDNPQSFAADLTRECRKQWVNGTFTVATPRGPVAVGVKAYGKFLQRLTVNGITDGGHFATQGAMRDCIVHRLTA